MLGHTPISSILLMIIYHKNIIGYHILKILNWSLMVVSEWCIIVGFERNMPRN